MQKVRLLICPLVSSDLRRAIRCVESALNQYENTLEHEVKVVINSKDESFVSDMTTYCLGKKINFEVTVSDGTASTGKNSVFNVFNNTDYTHLTQLDGDDIFYPTFLRHIERHLTRYPNTDVLSTIPCDSIFENSSENYKELKNGDYACLWGNNYVDFRDYLPFGRDPIVDNVSIPNYARLILFSKKASENFKYDSEVLVGEDLKIHFDFLWAHQHDELSYWFTTASDIWVRDTCSFGMQKKVSNHKVDGKHVILHNNDMFEKVKSHVLGKMYDFRTGPAEIPVDVAPMFLYYEDKINFLNKII